MALSGRQGGNGEDERGKEGGRKEGSEGERKTISIKMQSPTIFFKEELASVL